MRRMLLAGAVAAGLAATVAAAPAAVAAPAAPAPAGIVLAPAQWIGIGQFWYYEDCLAAIWIYQVNGAEAMCQYNIGVGLWIAYVNV